MLGRIGGRQPVFVVNVYYIHRRYTSLYEWNMIVKDIIFDTRDKNILIPKFCGRIPNRITKLPIGIPVHEKCRICGAYHIDEEHGLRFYRHQAYEGLRAKDPIPARDLAVVFCVKENQPDWWR